MKYIYLFLFSIIIGWTSCMPYEEETVTKIQLDYSNTTLQKIIDFKNQRLTDSLTYYLDAKNPTFRYIASLGFASSKDSTGLEQLYPLLSDPVDDVRSAVAFAIGQIGDTLSIPYLLQAFDNKDSLRIFKKSNSQILEAVGKCGQKAQLHALASVQTYQENDSLLLLGQTKGIYRFALRNIIHPKGTELMLKYGIDQKYPTAVRVMAANYLHRAKGITIDSSIQKICTNIQTEPNPNIRMGLVTALAKSKLDFARDTLINLYQNEKDYRVKCNIIRSFSFFNYADVITTVFQALEDKNPHIAQTAADYFYHNGIPEDGKIYRNWARNFDNILLKSKLYAASNKNLRVYFTQAKSKNTQELLSFFKNTEFLHEKVAILNALAEFEWNYTNLVNLGLNAEEPVLKSTACKGLVNILKSPRFDKTFGLGKKRKANEIKAHIIQGIKSKDAGTIAEASIALADSTLNFNLFFEQTQTDLLFLDTILRNISLPKEIETYQELSKAINFLKGEQQRAPTVAYNHDIEWDMMQVLGNRTRGIIQTNKGKIVLEFYPQESPATTSNFIRLTKDGHYDGKVIHRVVPNFVVQAGCDRGDGYGSENYTIRSEFSPVYYNDEGYIGMASAGNDTESTQWFITHSPTPHLDGNYTIFGKVKDGMDVVHQLEIGDIIEKAVIKF